MASMHPSGQKRWKNRQTFQLIYIILKYQDKIKSLGIFSYDISIENDILACNLLWVSLECSILTFPFR